MIPLEDLLAHPCRKCGAAVGEECVKEEDYLHRSHAARFRRAVATKLRREGSNGR